MGTGKVASVQTEEARGAAAAGANRGEWGRKEAGVVARAEGGK